MALTGADLPNAIWHKSSYSGSNAECVEVSHAPDLVAVRDSKHPAGGVLPLTPTTFAAFLNTLR
ncbi:DUF397 domain-containing protein [Amycolatopsis nigrescens]|uniref:DUF397 domain-containing protein n=1 Tax=Amycolatopsis nigrescens TaxID=381445 RepID=UPI00035C0A38|nr:DUF397 domain-containing protein [Amycolatopsis nigrescens]